MKQIVLIAMVLVSFHSIAQKHWGTPVINYEHYFKSIGAFGGVYFGDEIIGEIGVGAAILDESENLDFTGAGLSLEFNPRDDVYGIKLDAWKTLPLVPINVGVATVSYFQEDQFNQTLRPTIGLSYNYFRFSYAFDFVIGRQNIQEINRHQLFLRYYVPIWKKQKHPNFLERQE